MTSCDGQQAVMPDRYERVQAEAARLEQERDEKRDSCNAECERADDAEARVRHLDAMIGELLHMLDGAGMGALVRKYRKRLAVLAAGDPAPEEVPRG